VCCCCLDQPLACRDSCTAEELRRVCHPAVPCSQPLLSNTTARRQHRGAVVFSSCQEVQSRSAPFQSFLQTPANPGCARLGSSGQQETRHIPQIATGCSAARERLQTEGEKFGLLPWEHFQASAACECRYCPWEKALSANCKPLALCEHLSLSRSPRALCPALYGVSDSCRLLQACPSASCHDETEMEKPQLLLAGSCQLRGVLWDRQAPACSKAPWQGAASRGAR